MTAVSMTHAELAAEARRRFGDDRGTWAFICPNCGDVATVQDFTAAGADPGVLGQECIGRSLVRPPASRGCTWCAYGLFRGPWLITMPDGSPVYSFALAEVPA